MRLSMKKQIVVVMGMITVVIGGIAGPASALTPETTNVQTVVNTEYWDSVALWKPIVTTAYRRTWSNPGVQYYDYFDTYGRLVDLSTPCGSTQFKHGQEGFYCPANWVIYIDFNQQQDNITRYGDGAVAFWLDHEFAHHTQTLLGTTAMAPWLELNADCLAGVAFKYGISNTRRLNAGDYTEARNQIWALTGVDVDHGTRTQRLSAFDYGYASYSTPSCLLYW